MVLLFCRFDVGWCQLALVEANGFTCFQKLLSLPNNASLVSNLIQVINILDCMVISRWNFDLL